MQDEWLDAIKSAYGSRQVDVRKYVSYLRLGTMWLADHHPPRPQFAVPAAIPAPGDASVNGANPPPSPSPPGPLPPGSLLLISSLLNTGLSAPSPPSPPEPSPCSLALAEADVEVPLAEAKGTREQALAALPCRIKRTRTPALPACCCAELEYRGLRWCGLLLLVLALLLLVMVPLMLLRLLLMIPRHPHTRRRPLRRLPQHRLQRLPRQHRRLIGPQIVVCTPPPAAPIAGGWSTV
ncbi:hypothetical protein B0H14DRAFT_3440574 [Mycena olivaceomarginata]|nr:hypothetical protein B0H14DRAFT_3440574 [Mycena olivaceomarginata]